MIRVNYRNPEGTGFNGNVEVEEGTTALEFFRQRMDGTDPSGYTIRVNGRVPEEDYYLQDGDKYTVTPENVKGGIGDK